MSLKKVGKVWSFRIDAGTDPRTGKRKQIYRSGFATKKDALTEMHKLQMEVMSGIYTEPTKHLFKDFILDWLHGTYNHEVQSSTFERAEASVRNHLIPYFQDTHLDKITTYAIDQLYAQKLQVNLANATVKVMHNILSKAFQKALKWGLIKKNPVIDATPPSIKKKRKEIWSVEEAKTFLEVCEQENYLTLFSLALFTGMRRGEILALRWKNVDLNKSVIHVEESLARIKAEGLFVKEVKTANSERDVFLSPSLRDALANYKLQQEEHPTGLVFPSKNGTYLDPQNLLRK